MSRKSKRDSSWLRPGGERQSGRPRSWMFDPVLAGYRRLLSGEGETGNGAGTGLARVAHRGALMRMVHAEGAVAGGEGVNPPVLLLLKGYVPIRLDCSGTGLLMRVLKYELEGGLSRCEEARRVSVGTERAGEVLAEARQEFCRLRREILSRTVAGLGVSCGIGVDECAEETTGGTLRIGSVGAGTRGDELWLSRQLSEATGGLASIPVRLMGDGEDRSTPEADVEVAGVRVRVGSWVYVRLETRGGLVMTEPALLMGAERLGGAVRLVLRGADGSISTCWTRGPGWERRVVPVAEGEVWKAVSVSEVIGGRRRESA